MKIILPILFIFILSTSSLQADNKVDLINLYKELHANPELSFKEEKTSKKLANILRDLGLEVTENACLRS